MKYRRVPRTIDAIRWTGSNEEEVADFRRQMGDDPVRRPWPKLGQQLDVPIFGDSIVADPGDYIVFELGHYRVETEGNFELAWIPADAHEASAG